VEKIEEGGDSGFLDLVALDSRIRHAREGMLRRRRTAAVSCGRMQPGTGEETNRRRGGNG